MKFKEVEDKIKPIHIDTPKQINRIKQTITNIYSYNLFGAVAVIFMKPGTKGNFKYISTLINNGKEAASWTIRVYYTKGYWSAQIAPHPDIIKDNIDISIVDFLDGNDNDEISILANTHMGTIKSLDGYKVENVINLLIEKLRNHRLEGIKNTKLFPEYKKNSIDGKYKINFTLNTDSEEAQIESLKKYIHILLLLLEKEILDNERNELKEMTNHPLNNKDKENLLILSHKYFSQSERVKMAMNYIL